MVVCAALLASMVLLLAASSSWRARTAADQTRAKALPASRASAEAHERTGRERRASSGGLDLHAPLLAPSRTATTRPNAPDAIAATAAEPLTPSEARVPSSHGRGTRRMRPAVATSETTHALPGPEFGSRSAGADVAGESPAPPIPTTAPNPERSYRLSQRELKDVFP